MATSEIPPDKLMGEMGHNAKERDLNPDILDPIPKPQKPRSTRGGKRPQREGGNAKKIEGGQPLNVYVDETTIAVLEQIGPNKSEAVRTLARQWLANRTPQNSE